MQKGQAPSSLHETGQAVVLVLVGMLVIVAAAGGAYYFGKSQVPKPQAQNPVIVPQTPQSSSSSSSLLPVVTKNNETLTPELQKQILPLNETANWKTYTNVQYGFELKYPSDFYDDQATGESFTAYFQGRSGYPYSMIVNVEMRENSFDKFINDLFKKRGIVDKQKKESITGGKRALIVQTDDDNAGLQLETWIDVTPKMVVSIILLSSKKDVSASLQQLNDQILSTFKFIDQNQTISNTATGEKGITLEEARQIEPLYPAKLTLSQSGNTKILQWEGTGEDAGYYQLYRKTDINQKWVPLTKVQIQGDNRGSYEYKDSTVQPNLSYIYGISFVNSLGTESKITEGDTK